MQGKPKCFGILTAQTGSNVHHGTLRVNLSGAEEFLNEDNPEMIRCHAIIREKRNEETMHGGLAQAGVVGVSRKPAANGFAGFWLPAVLLSEL